MKQNYHFIVPKSHFKLVKGEDKLTTYTFNTHQAKHTFCSICGVQSFYTPRSNQDGYGNYPERITHIFINFLTFLGVMPHCISGKIMDKTKIRQFNGQEWESEIVKQKEIKKFSKV